MDRNNKDEVFKALLREFHYTESNDRANTLHNEISDMWERLQSRVTELEAALEIYADTDSWSGDYWIGEGSFGFEIARDALKGAADA